MTKREAWRFRVLISLVRDAIYTVDALRLPGRPRWVSAGCPGESIRVGDLAAWQVTPTGTAAAWIVICPGIGDRMHYWQGVQAWLAARSVGSVVFHYSSYPGSGGRTTPGQLEQDGKAVYQWLRGRVGEPVYLLGFSLGSGVAAAIAGDLRPPPSGLILCSGYTTLRAAARRVVRLPGLERLLPDIWSNTARLRALSMRVLVVHSAADWLFPIAMAEEMARGHALCRLERWSHNAAHSELPDEYWRAVLEFVLRFCPIR